MTDAHTRARGILVASLAGAAPLPDAAWLDAHLDACAACRTRREDLQEGLRVLRLPETAADGRLVARTRQRLHARALELHGERELHSPLLAASGLALVSGVATTIGMIRALATLGVPAGVPLPLLAAAGVGLWFLPASLAALALLARPWRDAHAPEVES